MSFSLATVGRRGLSSPPISEHDADMAITTQSPLEASWPI
jgi:hypothetical protein